MPPISTWTQTQSIGFSILFGLVGAALLIGALYLLARWAERRPRHPSRIEPDKPWPRGGTAEEVPGPTVGPNARAVGIRLGDVVDCERCGGHHKRRLLLPLTNPPGGATHYTTCPDVDEPVFVLLIPATADELKRQHSGLVDTSGAPIPSARSTDGRCEGENASSERCILIERHAGDHRFPPPDSGETVAETLAKANR